MAWTRRCPCPRERSVGVKLSRDGAKSVAALGQGGLCQPGIGHGTGIHERRATRRTDSGGVDCRNEQHPHAATLNRRSALSAVLSLICANQFPHFPQCIRIHDQYTHRRIVPFMLLCVVTTAIKFPRPARQNDSPFQFSRPLFIESLCNQPSSLFSVACALFGRSFTQERKSTLLVSCACARFCRTRGYLRSPKNSPCYHQLANARITLREKLCDCTHP